MLRLRIVSVGILLAGLLQMGFVPRGVAQEKKEAAPATAASQSATSQSATSPSPTTPEASPKDVQSLDAIVAAIYDVISGPPGARDWNRFNSLFAKDARLIAVRMPKDGKPSLAVMTPKDYADRAGSYFMGHGLSFGVITARLGLPSFGIRT